MRKQFAILAALTLLLSPASLLAQGKGGKSKEKKETSTTTTTPEKQKEKEKEKEKKAAKTGEVKKSAETSNKGGDTRGRERALEAQKIGQGAEHRGFETPKGLAKEKEAAKKTEATATKTKEKEKEKEKAKEREKEKEKAKQKETTKAKEGKPKKG